MENGQVWSREQDGKRAVRRGGSLGVVCSQAGAWEQVEVLGQGSGEGARNEISRQALPGGCNDAIGNPNQLTEAELVCRRRSQHRRCRPCQTWAGGWGLEQA